MSVGLVRFVCKVRLVSVDCYDFLFFFSPFPLEDIINVGYTHTQKHIIPFHMVKWKIILININTKHTTQGKIDLRNESGRPMKVKVVGEVSEK